MHLAELRGARAARCRSSSAPASTSRSRSCARPTWRSSSPSRRTRSPTWQRARARHRAAPQADARGGPRRALQGSGRSVPARLRLRDVDDGLRRAVVLDDLPRSSDAQPHADADDRAREPRLPREGERADRRLRRRLPRPGGGARDLRGGPARRGRARTSSATRRRSSASSRRRSRELRRVRERWDVDLDALARAEGFEFIALRDASVEALLVDDGDAARVPRALATACGGCSRRSCPTRRRRPTSRLVGVARNLAETDPLARRAARHLARSRGRSSELLDRSVGAEEYVIRAAAEGADADALIDLNTIDFDALAARLAGRKRSAAQRLARQLGDQRRGERAAQPDPARPRRASCAS